MTEIQGKAKTVRELLKGIKYSIDYYQREYKWQEKQIAELIDDLTDKFLGEYSPTDPRRQVAYYPHYFLGSIIISRRDVTNYIVDGQQRLTSLTLLLIFLRHLQNETKPTSPVNVDELIFSELYGERSFNLDIPERNACMDGLFESGNFDPANHSESVQTLVERYNNIGSCFPDELRGPALPYFIDWLLENVHLVEITAFSDNDAYTIFETMNDRGLSLSPTEMLKGYLLANIDQLSQRNLASKRWKDQLDKFNTINSELEADFFKAWLRSQYATRIRERKRGAKPEDFDRIGTEYHRWLREASNEIGLNQAQDFFNFIEKNFSVYSQHYLRIFEATQKVVSRLEHVCYNADRGFTLQTMLLLAPVRIDDSEEIAHLKFRLVAQFLDILLAWRIWNSRSIAYSTMQYAMFLIMRDIRGMDVQHLAQRLHNALCSETETFDSNQRVRLNQQNRFQFHLMLARITDYVEVQSGNNSRYDEYVTAKGNRRYEIEHIWANHPERHVDELPRSDEFDEYRNQLGGLLLLPKSFNASYGALPYESKLPHYNAQNLLARSLHPQAYDHNPGYLRFIQQSGLPFRPHLEYRKKDLEERTQLYRLIAKRIWDPENLLREVEL